MIPTECWLMSVGDHSDRPFLCHGRPDHICARRAHRSTRAVDRAHWSIGFFHGLLQAPFLLPLTFDLCTISSLPIILHLGENFLNLSRTLTNIWRNWYTISAKLTHDLSLSAQNEIVTRSWQNRHTISTWPTDETYSFKQITNTGTIDFHWSHQI